MNVVVDNEVFIYKQYLHWNNHETRHKTENIGHHGSEQFSADQGSI